ncbi:hypothetical protein [Amycolatopsis sp. Hca4]|uniref:hypothetical protein n=1 Tax=Amycolatopsis sp. Hca4 TaxID=2742131 RepID=UPI0020CAE5F3|nr:hypothetical protein [Amycolatopsis sp. Hca4]
MTDAQRNKEVVLDFLRLAFTEKRPADAFAEHVGESYIQHNPHAPASAAASARYLAGFVARRALGRGAGGSGVDGERQPDDLGVMSREVGRAGDGRFAAGAGRAGSVSGS